MQKSPLQSPRQTLKLFLVLLLTFGGVLTVFSAFYYHVEVSLFLEKTTEREQHTVNLQKQIIQRQFQGIVGDLRFLSEQNELQQFLLDPTSPVRRAAEREYRFLARFQDGYTHLQYIDASGQERIRIHNLNGQPRAAPHGELRQHTRNFAFQETLRLERDEVFISPFDLHVDGRAAKASPKPVIRFGTPVFDSNGTKRGIVLINYLGQNLIDTFKAIGATSRGQAMLLNPQGQWLASPNADGRGVFAAPEGPTGSFPRHYPRAWERMQSDTKGQFRTSAGIFSYATYYPLSGIAPDSASAPRQTGEHNASQCWRMVSFLPQADIQAYASTLRWRMLLYNAAVFLLIATGSWFLALAVNKRRLYQARLEAMAHYDTLTGLPNRTLFFERLHQLHSQAVRYERRYGIVFLDLDDFKPVNDTHGHKAGDALLRQVAQRLQAHLRQADTVARLGGDEFAVLLSDIQDHRAAQQVADKLVTSLGEPFDVDQIRVHIGVSAGAAIYPDDSDTAEAVLNRADQCMYRHKTASHREKGRP